MTSSIKRFRFGRHQAVVESGWTAEHADSSVIVHLGQSAVLATCLVRAPAQSTECPKLAVSLVERSYARGQIPGHPARREERSDNRELARAQLIQALFNAALTATYRADVELSLQVLSDDPQVDPLLAAVMAASAALGIAGVPLDAPLILARLARVDGQFLVNPYTRELGQSQCDLWVCGDSLHVTHVSGHARELDESKLIRGIETCHEDIRHASRAIQQLVLASRGCASAITLQPLLSQLQRRVRSLAKPSMFEILGVSEHSERRLRLENLRKAVQIAICALDDDDSRSAAVDDCFDQCLHAVIRERCLGGHLRHDQREPGELRAREIQTQLFPRTHGSARYKLADCQALAMTTLGLDKAALDLDGATDQDRFAVHLYRLAEVHSGDPQARMQAIEIGRWVADALRPMLPAADIFPYATRVDIEQVGAESCSRDEALCAATQSLLDAGVPLRAPVAALEIGLLRSPSHFMTLSDLDGAERKACDLVATIAGTQAGITAIHLHSRCLKLSSDMLEVMLRQARQSRLELLLRMNQSLDSPRALSPFAPRVQVLKISAGKTGQLVGRGGSTVKAICQQTRSNIEVFPDGSVRVSAGNDHCLQNAILAIQATLKPLRPGQVYEGSVSGLLDDAVLVSLSPGREGLLPVDQLLDRHQQVHQQFKVGDRIRVVCQALNRQGQALLSIRALYDEDLADAVQTESKSYSCAEAGTVSE